MINLFKKGFIYLALTLLVLVGISVESAFAAEVVDYEEGVKNLNNTPENSAVVGSKLLNPEIGWKRYDTYKSLNILSEPKAPTIFRNSVFYKGNTSFYNDTVTFNFYGSKFRIISAIYSTRSTNLEVSIDGTVIDTFSENVSDLNQNTGKRLAYEKNNLPLGNHVIVIKNLDLSKIFEIDAIDVDGKLLALDEVPVDEVPVDEVPDAESITLDKNNLELFEGDSEKLTATVSPDTANVIWTSSDESIATVDQNGNITAIREGEAIITAKLENTELVATATVIVKKLINESSSAILSITLVNGITKEYDVTNVVLNNYLNWFESAQGTSTFKFSKTISPYKKVTENIVHDKIASFEVREY